MIQRWSHEKMIKNYNNHDDDDDLMGEKVGCGFAAERKKENDSLVDDDKCACSLYNPFFSS